jgi:hypothetical protein
MKPVLMTGHPRVDEIRGAVAIQRGPVVYCLEEVDQDATIDLLDVQIDADGPLVDAWHPDLLGGVVTVEAVGSTVDLDAWAGGMYRPYATRATPTARRSRSRQSPTTRGRIAGPMPCASGCRRRKRWDRGKGCQGDRFSHPVTPPPCHHAGQTCLLRQSPLPSPGNRPCRSPCL